MILSLFGEVTEASLDQITKNPMVLYVLSHWGYLKTKILVIAFIHGSWRATFNQLSSKDTQDNFIFKIK